MRTLALVCPCVLLLLLGTSATSLQAQSLPPTTSDDQMGIQPYQSYHGGDIDVVNLTTGTLNLNPPFLAYPQRGKFHLSFNLFYNNQWQHQGEFCPPHLSCRWVWGYTPTPTALPLERSDAFVGTAHAFEVLGVNVPVTVGAYTYYYANWSLQTADGSKHPLGNLGSYSWNNYFQQGTGPWETLDTTGWRVNGTLSAGAGGWQLATPTSIIGADGVSYATATAFGEDPNGNMITQSNAIFTDSLGRQIPVPPTASSSSNTDTSGCPQPPQVSLPVAFAVLWSVPGPSGSSAPYKFCYATVAINIPPGSPSNVYPGASGNQTKLQSILLPNGQTWNFTYNDPGDGSTYNGSPINYGTLTQVILPTAGTISYSYATQGSVLPCQNAGRWVASRAVNANDGTGSHTWTYSYTLGSSTTVTDPLGNYTLHTLSNLGNGGGCSLYETQTQYYQNGGTLLKTVNTAYSYLLSANSNGYINVVPTQVTTVWPDGKTSKVAKSYDSGFNYLDYLGNSINPNAVPNVGIYGKVVSESDYDYGQGGAGPLLRTTNTTYLALSNSNYLTNNLLDLKSQVAVFSGTGTSGDCTVISAKACTKYAYEESGLQTSNISTQHDSSPPAGTYRGNQTSVSRWLNTTNSYLKSTAVFYDTGMVYQSTDPLSNTTTFNYDPAFAGAYLTKIQLPNTGSTQHITYKNYDFNTGLLASHTDENGNQTTFSYDNMFRLKQVTFPTGGGQATITRQETTSPFTATLTRQITGSLNMVTTNVFDGVGRVTQTQLTSDPDGTTYTDFTYDALGRKSTVSNPHRSQGLPTDGITTYNYDPLNRTTKVIPPDGTSSSNYVLTEYCDNVTKVTDQASHWRRSTVDGLGRMTEVDEPNSTTATVNVCPGTGEPIWVTSYAYDTLNNLTNATQSSSRQRTFVYDSLSRLTSSTNPEAGNVTYTYDADGNVQTKKDARNITITYSYDPLNRVLSKTYSNGDPTISYTYDQSACLGQSSCYNIGHRTGMTDAAGSEAWAYDAMGREAAEQRTTNSITKSTSYTYNLDGSLATLTYPSGRVITYAPGGAGRPLSAVDNTNSINYALSATYAPQGALATLLLGKTNTFSGINLNDSFDSRLQPCRIFASTATTTPSNCADLTHVGNILDFTYSFLDSNSKNNGNVIQITNNRDNTRTQSFTYDQVNRIATAKTQATSGSNCWSYNYGYDQWANLLSASALSGYSCTEGTLSLGVNGSNQINNTGFSYDVSGNMTNDGTNAYGWDAESQIKSAAGVNYFYDGDGNRVQKSNGKLYWYGAGSEVLDESDLSGNFTDEYVFFGGKRIAHRVVSGGNIYYYAEDFLGSSRVITSATGSVCYDADFLPYGTEHTVTNTCPQNYKFTGKERDTETGNDDFGARYFSSSLGRWLSPDWSAIPAPVPYANLTNPQTLNLYAMVHDNPETFVDLDGHEDEGGGGSDSGGGDSGGGTAQDGPDKKNGAQPATTGSPQNTAAQPNQQPANQDQKKNDEQKKKNEQNQSGVPGDLPPQGNPLSNAVKQQTRPPKPPKGPPPPRPVLRPAKPPSGELPWSKMTWWQRALFILEKGAEILDNYDVVPLIKVTNQCQESMSGCPGT